MCNKRNHCMKRHMYICKRDCFTDYNEITNAHQEITTAYTLRNQKSEINN